MFSMQDSSFKRPARRVEHDDSQPRSGSGSAGRVPTPRRWHGYLLPDKVIRRAGARVESFVVIYWAIKALCGVSMPVLLSAAGVTLSLAGYIAVGVLASFAVDIELWRRMKRRQRRIRYALSYFLDMVTAFLRAGMSLEAAILRATEFGLPPRNPLRHELGIVRSEIYAGRSRREAFAALWDRTGVSDLQTLATLFRTGFDIGTPILASLEHQAELLRERTRERRQKAINRKMTQAMVPLVLFNFPMMLIIVFYPPVLEFSRLLFISP